MNSSTAQDHPLINALLNANVYDHTVDKIELIETHISWVILTGPYAYKIKKPVNLGFLDFSSLDKRKQCCEEELRLNKRTSTDVYLEVISINGSAENPQLSTDGEIIEYAVKMNQFPQQSQLDRALLNNKLSTEKLDAFAHMIADFHQSTDVADISTQYGDAHHVLEPMNENLTQIRERIQDKNCHHILDELELWLQLKYESLRPLLDKRKQSGFIRECHGDLHLRNLAWVNNKPIAFDCIEFNPYLRWIDVISDIAFLVMDLQARNQTELAQRFLNTYLEATGDYSGVQLLSFYMMYRALVRAKVDAINMTQSHVSSIDTGDVTNELYSYLNLAKSYTQATPVKLIITHGASASGKSTFSQQLLQYIPCIRIRSDIERKRMAGALISDKTQITADENIYTEEFTNKLYAKLALLSETIIDSGYSVIIDAAFLNKRKRDQFRELAEKKNVEFVILSFSFPEEVLRQRISKRTGDASDADLSVLETQLLNYQPLNKYEQTYSHVIDNETIAKNIAKLL